MRLNFLLPARLVVVFLITGSMCSAQSPVTNQALDSANHVATDSLKNPHYKSAIESRFPGGNHAWIQYLSDNLKYPKKAVKKKVEGTVVIQFIVEKDGSVSSVEAIRGDPLLIEEAIRIVKGSPAWIPAQGDGNALKSYKRQPISFALPK